MKNGFAADKLEVLLQEWKDVYKRPNSKAWSSSAEAMAAALHRTSRRYDQARQAFMRKFGLGLSDLEFHIGYATLLQADEPEPLYVGNLEAMVGIDQSGLSIVLGRMQKRGLVKLVEGSDDRRKKVVTLTSKGRKDVTRVVAHFAKETKHLMFQDGEFPEDPHEIAQFLGLLLKLMRRLETYTQTLDKTAKPKELNFTSSAKAKL